MCYAAPGPRCSGHTKTALDKAAAKVTEAGAHQQAVHDSACRGGATDEEYRDAARAYQRARDAQMAAQSRYDASPAGIIELEKQVEATRPGSIDGKEARERLAVAVQTREAQLAAYRALHRADPRPEWEDGPEQVAHPIPEIAAADETHAAALAAEERARERHQQARDRVHLADRERILRRTEAGEDPQAYAQWMSETKELDRAQQDYDDARDRVRVAWESTMSTRHAAVAQGLTV